ncbi:uncharacterized protein LOC115891857 [Sitophilus oryzae]|uniref:Uncharacterized protein LOC115891857 n=1 Tax=Sitophilus oryzae TaxID=7048 RepID=A0A6J2YZQ6_SITOR|nr:uncharacterized protein LOC115891857 [Sitophilus oryzae]
MGDCGCAPGGQRQSRRHHHRRSRGHHQRPPVPYDRPMVSRPTAPPSRIPPWNCGPGLARQREAKQYNAGPRAAAGGTAQRARLDETYNVGARGGPGGRLDRTYTVAGGRPSGALDRTYTATAGGGPGGRLDRTYTVAAGGGPGRSFDRTYNATAGSGPGERLDRTYTVGSGRSFDRTCNATAGSGPGGRLDRTYTRGVGGPGRSFDRTAGSEPGGRLDGTYTVRSGRSFDRTYNATAGNGSGRRLDRTYTAAAGPCAGEGATCLDSTYTAHPSIRTPPNYLDYPPFDTAVARMYPDRHMDSWEMMGLTPPGPDTPRGNKTHPPRYARRLDFSDTSDTPPRPFSPSQGSSNLSRASPHSGDQDSSMRWFRPYMDSSHLSTGQTTARKEIFDSIRVGRSPGLSAVSSSSPEDVSYDWSSETDPIFGAQQRSRTRSPSPGPRQEVRGRRLNFSSDSSACEASRGGVCESGYSGDVEESFPSVSSQPGPSNAMFGAGGRQEENWSPMPIFEAASYDDYSTEASSAASRRQRTPAAGGRLNRTYPPVAGVRAGARSDNSFTTASAICLGAGATCLDDSYSAGAGGGSGGRLDRTYDATAGRRLDSTYTAHPSIRTPPNYLDYPRFDTAVARMYPDRHMDSWEMMGLTPPGPDTPRGNKTHPPRYARKLDFSDTSDTPPRPFSPSQGPSNLNVTRTCPSSSRSPHSGDQDSSMGWFRPYMDSSHLSTGQTTARKEIFDSIRVGRSPGLSGVSRSSPQDVSSDWSSETDPIFGAQRSRTRSPSPGPRQEVRGRRLNFSSDSSACEASQGGVCEDGYSGDVEESFPSVSQAGPSNAMFGAGGRQEENWSPMPIFEAASYDDYSPEASSAASRRQRTPAAGGRLNRTYPPAAGARAGARSDNSFTTASAICLGAGATCLDDSYSAGAGGGRRLDRTYDATAGGGAGGRLDSTYTAHPSIRTPPNYLDYPRFDTAVPRMYPDRHMDSWEMMGLTPAAPDTPRGNITYPPAYARRLNFSNDSSACEASQGEVCESGYAGDVEESFPSMPRPGPSNAMAGARGRQAPAAGAGQKAAGGRRKWGSPTPAFEAASIYGYSPSAASSAASGGQRSDACVDDGASCLNSTYTDASEGGGPGGLFVMTYPPVTGYRAGPRADGTFTTASAMCLGGGAACLDDSYPAQPSERTPPDDMEVQGGYGSRYMDSYEMMGLTPPGPETPRRNITHPPAYARRLDFSGDSSECEASHGEACGGGYDEDVDESYSAFQPGAASSTFAARGRQTAAGPGGRAAAAAGQGQRPGAAAGGRQRWGSPTPAYEARSIYDYSSTEGSWSGGSSSGEGQSSCRPCRHTY